MPDETSNYYSTLVAPFLILFGTFIAIMVGGYIVASFVYARTRMPLLEEKGARLGASMLFAVILCLIFFA